MEAEDIKAAPLSEAAGLGTSAVRDIFRKTGSPKLSTAAAIARELGRTVDEIMQIGLQSLPPSARAGGSATAASEQAMIDVFDVAASAGHGAVVEGETVIERLSFPLDYLTRITKTHPRHLKIIGVQGDSMEPTVKHDDVVMLDTTKTSLDYDGLFVLRWGDALHVKRVGRASNGSVRIISDNKDIYPPIEMPRTDITVVGKVIWIGKKV
jgi:phage repressor protein C with HTH and peptisase S24 domain